MGNNNKIRILIITPFFPPLNSIASLRPYSWAKEWTLLGHDVTILTTKKSPSHEPLQLKNPGFQVFEIPLPRIFYALKSHNQTGQSAQKNSLKRVLLKPFHQLIEKFRKRGLFNACRLPDITHFWIAPSLKKIKKTACYDIVISTSGPYTAHVLAYKIKQNNLAKKWIADYRDPWSTNFAFPGLFPFNLFETFWEKNLIKKADAITTVSDPLNLNLKKLHRKENVYTIPNGVDYDLYKNLNSASVFPNDEKCRILYTGSIYPEKRDPSLLFQAVREMKNDNLSSINSLEIIFVGTPSAYLDSLIEKYNVKKWVKYLGFVNYFQSLAMQRDAHALLFLPWADNKVEGVLTGKLFEYLESGTPILSIGRKSIDEAQQLILDSKIGHVFQDVADVKNYLKEMLHKKSKTKIEHNSDILKKYNRKQIAKDLLEIISDDILLHETR